MTNFWLKKVNLIVLFFKGKSKTLLKRSAMTRIRARSLAASLLYLVTSFFLKSEAVRLCNGKPKIVWRILSFSVSRWDAGKKS